MVGEKIAGIKSRLSQRIRNIEDANNGDQMLAASSLSQPQDMITLRNHEGGVIKEVQRYGAMAQLAKVGAYHQQVSLTQNIVNNDCSMTSVGIAQANLHQVQLAQHMEAVVLAI